MLVLKLSTEVSGAKNESQCTVESGHSAVCTGGSGDAVSDALI